MNEQNIWLTFFTIIGGLSAIPVILIAVRKIIAFIYETISYKHLKIRAIKRRVFNGIPQVTIKVAVAGKDTIIVEDVEIVSKLMYVRPIEGALAWLQLSFGYFHDDVIGLNRVLGKSFPYNTYFPSAPLHKIKYPIIRKILGIIFGIMTMYYFLVFIFPLFWPLLFAGPYLELKLSSKNDKIKLFEKDSKVEFQRPFILKPGDDNSFSIRFQNSIYYRTLIMQKITLNNAKFTYTKEPKKLRILKLPQNNDFEWKIKETLRIKVSGKLRKYSVKLGNAFGNLELN